MFFIKIEMFNQMYAIEYFENSLLHSIQKILSRRNACHGRAVSSKTFSIKFF
ncbi:hypothetical protein LEP1GSC052_1969 [Leptospira kmetyi serovar Malaysia str. Bejo-Iso9]|nr:hypothetical protein LEP1GSC052_1969 [Leptospira kmetyi serovar Malaysia str. Bejo-Iso9]